MTNDMFEKSAQNSRLQLNVELKVQLRNVIFATSLAQNNANEQFFSDAFKRSFNSMGALTLTYL